MGLLDSLFSGVKVFVRELVSVVGEAVRVVLEEIDRSSIGRAATEFVQGVTKKYFRQAGDLAEEEREFAEKFERDGKRSEKDEERLREIQAEREQLRKEMEAAKAREAAEELKSGQNDVIAANMTDDELSAAVGILATKECGECGGTMRIRQGANNSNSNKRNFWWQCTINPFTCPTIKLSTDELSGSVIRRENPDLDGDANERRRIWTKDDIVNDAHRRLRQNHLDENDEEVVCPHHVLPMKLVQKRAADGRMLSSYEYVCIGVQANGRACDYKVPLETYPQLSATLLRRGDRGII